MNDQPPLIYGDGRQTRDFVYSTDVAEASILAAASPKAVGAVVNVGSGSAISINDFAALMAKVVGKTHVGVAKADPRPGEIRFSEVDTAAAKRILGFQPEIDLEEGVKNFVEWYARHRDLFQTRPPK